MRLVHPRGWFLALGAYAIIGMVCGTGWAERIAETCWGRAGLGTAATINLVLPLAALAIAICHPRVWTAVLGGGLLIAGYVAGVMCCVDRRPWEWTGAMLRDHTQPIEVAAALGYAVVGCFGVLVVSPWRSMGVRRTPGECDCGYALAGLPGDCCPECGRRLGAADRL
jgi:hypothetical protein